MYKSTKTIMPNDRYGKMHTYSSRFYLAILLWFSTAVLLGMLFENYLSFNFVQRNYHAYIDVIKQKQKFSSAIFCLLILMPFFTVYFYKHCIKAVELKGIHLIILIFAVFTGCYYNSPLFQFDISKGDALIKFIIYQWDWLGAFLFCATIVMLVIYSLSMLVKFLRQEITDLLEKMKQQ